jgi:hypothetical protein
MQKLIAEAQRHIGKAVEGERPLLEASAKQKTVAEKIGLCVTVTSKV